MNQRRILVITAATAMVVTLLISTIVTFSVTSSFAQNVNNEDDGIDNALTGLICNIARPYNNCDHT
jgi:hypothetical protein